MAIDHYSPCPCGSGKKLKFCKCVENTQDLEKVVKLIEGGQGLAALDRINQLLAKTPNAAWLLAIKGELALEMQELPTFRETADRFLKLKPDNPLALVMRSIVASIEDEPLENAARYLLDGMAESRESLPALTLPAINILVRALSQGDKTCMLGFWSDILATLTRESGPQDESPLLNPSINLLAKAPPQILDDPPGAAWKERLAEVISLVRSFRYAQAESKLRSILRDFADQPGPLSHLLRAQLAQLDQSAAYNTALKLAENSGISEESRCYFRAIALELEPGAASLQAENMGGYYEVDSEDRVIELLAQPDNIRSLSGEGEQEGRNYYAAVVGDEVPAKKVFNVFDRPLKPDESGERLIASLVATIVVFGRQTDKPGRVLVSAFRFPEHEPLLAELLESISLGPSCGDTSIPSDYHYSGFLSRARVLVNQPTEPLTLEETGRELGKDLLNLPLVVLGGKSPLEVRDDPSQRDTLLAILSHLEGEQGILCEDSAIAELYSALNLERPEFEIDNKSDRIQILNILQLQRIDTSKLSDDMLTGILVRSMNYGASRVFYRCSLEALSRPALAEQSQLRIAALSGLLALEPSVEKRLEHAVEIEQELVKSNGPVGRVVLQRIGLLNQLGRVEEAQQVLLEATKKYPDDQYLTSFLQYAMQGQAGGPQPMHGGDSPQQGSGLVLPGQDPGQASGSGDSESGQSSLWLPGQ